MAAKRTRVKKDAGASVSADNAVTFSSTATGFLLRIGKSAWDVKAQLPPGPQVAEPAIKDALDEGAPAVPATSASAEQPPLAALARGLVDYGLSTDDEQEFFISKSGGLCGVVRFKRKQDGGWTASLQKELLPRVVTPEAVEAGLMPPHGESALPKSLEAIVPTEFRYWEAPETEARAVRDALVENGFFNPEGLKLVDGEIRKVEVRYFLYEPQTQKADKPKRKPMTCAQKVQQAVPVELLEKAFNPFQADDWLEELDKNDAPGALALLSPPSADVSPRELAKAVRTLKGSWLVHVDDTANARAALSQVGLVFKLDSGSDLFAVNFAPVVPVQVAKKVFKEIDFQGLLVKVDRPKGFVQRGKTADGTTWEREYQHDYGYFPRTKGGDGDGLDVFVGTSKKAPNAYWVRQVKADGRFDEFKVFVGFDTAAAAKAAYKAHIPTQFFGGMREVPISFMAAMLNGDPAQLEKALSKGLPQGWSLDAVRRMIEEKLMSELYPDGKEPGCYVYVCDLYEDTCVYEYDGKMWQATYEVSAEGATLGKPTQVMRTYKPLTGSAAPTPGQPALPEDSQKRDRMIKIAKAENDEQYVLGIVLEPDIVDAQQDTYTAEEIRQAEYKYMEDHRNMGLMHKSFVNDGVKILESYLAPVDFELGGITVKKGTWLMGVRILDEGLWKRVKEGGLTGFSIGGSAIRTPA